MPQSRERLDDARPAHERACEGDQHRAVDQRGDEEKDPPVVDRGGHGQHDGHEQHGHRRAREIVAAPAPPTGRGVREQNDGRHRRQSARPDEHETGVDQQRIGEPDDGDDHPHAIRIAR